MCAADLDQVRTNISQMSFHGLYHTVTLQIVMLRLLVFFEDTTVLLRNSIIFILLDQLVTLR